jgi:hypothetical protein
MESKGLKNHLEGKSTGYGSNTVTDLSQGLHCRSHRLLQVTPRRGLTASGTNFSFPNMGENKLVGDPNVVFTPIGVIHA